MRYTKHDRNVRLLVKRSEAKMAAEKARRAVDATYAQFSAPQNNQIMCHDGIQPSSAARSRIKFYR